MKYLRQLLMILIFSFIGEVLHAVIRFRCRQVFMVWCFYLLH